MTRLEVEFIAEVAQGFEGNLQQGMLLLEAAISSGADSVKFQLIIADEICTPDYKYYNLFKSLEMPLRHWIKLAKRAESADVSLIVDIFGQRSLTFAKKMGVERVMLHATDLNNTDLLVSTSRSNFTEVFLGVGGGSLKEIRNALTILAGKKIVLMTGFQSYPTPLNQLRLNRIQKLRDVFLSDKSKIRVGYADHSLPDSRECVGLCAMACALGATVIEKHITLGEVMKLEDYESAVNPDKFADLINSVQGLLPALEHKSSVDGYSMGSSERAYRTKMRRNVVSRKRLKEGHVICENDVVLKRTGKDSGISNVKNVIGKKLNTQIEENQPLSGVLLD